MYHAGDFQGAFRYFDDVLRREPRNTHAMWNIGLALIKLDQPTRAISYLEQVVAIEPGDPDHHYVLALTNISAERPKAAVESLKTAVKLRPGWVEAWSFLGVAYEQSGNLKEAEIALHNALALKSEHPEALCQLAAVAMKFHDRIDEAIELFLKAISIQPSLVAAWNNLGAAYTKQNKTDHAQAAYKKAAEIEPRNGSIKCNEGTAALLKGDLNLNNWLKYEYRWVVLRKPPQRVSVPIWRGEKPIAGKSILLYAEQGIGDTLQFVRYVPLVANQGAIIHLEVQPSLKNLLAEFPGVSFIIGQGEPLPSVDLQCPLMSLPLAMNTTLANIPVGVPYVRAPSKRVSESTSYLPTTTGTFRVGVAWRGNPKHPNDANRSINFELFSRLFDVSSCKFYCLQFGLNEHETATLSSHPACVIPPGQINDFADTASIVTQLDLVISVDTSVAHLAGAMGKPVWTLLPFAPDWRWLLHRRDSPWYPTMRLFRQPKIGAWDEVIAAARAELQDMPSSPAG